MPPGKTKEKKTKSEAGRKDEEDEVTLCVSCNKSILYCVIVAGVAEAVWFVRFWPDH